MDSCICYHCAKKINKGDKVYWVESANDKILKPTCSKECAKDFKEFVVNKLKDTLKSIENQAIEEDIL